MNQIKIKDWKRVSKRTARKLYEEGKTIRVCPVKINPCNEYYPMSYDISKDDKFGGEPLEWEKKFDSRVNAFEYYNCQYNETGKYSAFYIKEEV